MFVAFVSAVVCWSVVTLQGQQGAALQFLTYCCKNNPPKTAAAAVLRLAFSSSVTQSISLILSMKPAAVPC